MRVGAFRGSSALTLKRVCWSSSLKETYLGFTLVILNRSLVFSVAYESLKQCVSLYGVLLLSLLDDPNKRIPFFLYIHASIFESESFSVFLNAFPICS